MVPPLDRGRDRVTFALLVESRGFLPRTGSPVPGEALKGEADFRPKEGDTGNP